MIRASTSRQKGLLILDALVWLGAFLGVIAVASYIIREVRIQTSAENAAKYAVQVASAVRAKIAAEGTGAVVASQTGTAWLRHTDDCADGTDSTLGRSSYLPICGFPETEPNFGMTITTDITNPSGSLVQGTITMGKLPRPYEDRYDLLQTMRRTVQNADPGAALPTGQTFLNVVFDDPATAISAADASSSPTFDLVIQVSNNSANDPYIRADGVRAWNADVTQDVSSADFIQVGSLSADGSAPADGDVEMARFVDSGDNNYLLDPDGTTSNLNTLNIENDLTVESDIVLPQLNDGKGNFLSNHLVWDKGVVNQGGTVAIHTCPNGSPEIHGSVVAIVATDTNANNSTGDFPNPKNLKGFNLYAETVSSPGDWTLWAKAFIDDEGAGYEVMPAAGSDWVQINYWTSCT